jgi:hypothetical protein
MGIFLWYGKILENQLYPLVEISEISKYLKSGFAAGKDNQEKMELFKLDQLIFKEVVNLFLKKYLHKKSIFRI